MSQILVMNRVKDFGKWAAHPHPIFLGVLPPPPPGVVLLEAMYQCTMVMELN